MIKINYPTLRFILIFCLFGLVLSVKGQDPHFSQTYASGSYLNPGITGLINGNYRISIQYRDQWRSISPFPIKSYTLNGEFRFALPSLSSKNKDYIGAGIAFFNDSQGGFDLNTNALHLTAAYHKSLSETSLSYLSLGVQFGLAQRGLNYEELTFEDQFNAVNGFTGITQEFLPPNTLAFGDFSAGLHFSSELSEKFTFNIGAGMFHILSPDFSFYRGTDHAENFEITDKYNRKIQLHSNAIIQLSEDFDITPRLHFALQSPSSEILLGNTFRFQLSNREQQAVQFGPFLRATKGSESWSLSSIVIMVGYEIKGVNLGISYDLEMDDILNEFVGQSAIELSIIYVGNYDNSSNFCPRF